ncbi:MAG: ABC transporter ATP-binding protein/permease [Treponema sp.]|jgi:putative ABC transport system permease protein|nr:ABC transporter ATP-binding protein/permease [Treponema sp.]
MLALQNIVKVYETGDTKVAALKGVNLEFRRNEFVCVLGPSGCGKTTLLNIIGGLDRYTSGDMAINGVSTTEYQDGDWDVYRNRSVGFVFQTYNLIPHQTVLANVELAMTLSGVNRNERLKRAADVLKQVGLEDQINKKPNQLSGGQMQRVAIARSLVNNPEILLADEPTGALDTATSLQIMEILKEVARDRLVIMVTHNPELANNYSTRIIRLKDGIVLDDSNPYATVEAGVRAERDKKKHTKPPLSFRTALSLSLNNLMTKKWRTFLTAFAGSIGIIGIALIAALSSGMNELVSDMEKETMSSYPISITKTTTDLTAMQGVMGQDRAVNHPLDKVYTNPLMSGRLGAMAGGEANDLKSFKVFLEAEMEKNDPNGLAGHVNDIQYNYVTPLTIYKNDSIDDVYQVNPSGFFDDLDMQTSIPGMDTDIASVWIQLPGDPAQIDAQYELLAGRFPANYDEVVLLVDENNEITDLALFALGLRPKNEIDRMVRAIQDGDDVDEVDDVYTYDEALAMTFKAVPNTEYYVKMDGMWEDLSKDEAYLREVIDRATTIKVAGVARFKSSSGMGGFTVSTIGYSRALKEYMVNTVNDSEIVREQRANPDLDVFSGMSFFMSFAASYEDNLIALGAAELDDPKSISIYPRDFEAKDYIADMIDDYNDRVTADGEENKSITYTDMVGLLMSSISTIINGVSYVLIAFVSISLVVSSIMIGIITYISVLERTKEIGILRSIGASKSDISRVFNAETLIEGFASGAIGVIIGLLLVNPMNAIIYAVSGLENVAFLSPLVAILLVVISMALCFIAGVIPAGKAAKQDPVTALRSE